MMTLKILQASDSGVGSHSPSPDLASDGEESPRNTRCHINEDDHAEEDDHDHGQIVQCQIAKLSKAKSKT